MRQVSILAETLSAQSPVAQLLIERGVQVAPGNLAAGHYLITGTCAVLHLPIADFSRWIVETIFRRITDFKRAVAEPVVIIEGSQNVEVRTVSAAALRGALAFIAVHNRVPVLFSSDEKETADLLFAMANQVQNGMGITLDAPKAPVAASDSSETEVTEEPVQPPSNGNGNGNGHGNHHSDATLVNLPAQIIAMIPEVAPSTARALLKRFGSLRGVFGANATDLTKIDGIGPKKAKKIASFLSRREPR